MHHSGGSGDKNAFFRCCAVKHVRTVRLARSTSSCAVANIVRIWMLLFFCGNAIRRPSGLKATCPLTRPDPLNLADASCWPRVLPTVPGIAWPDEVVTQGQA